MINDYDFERIDKHDIRESIKQGVACVSGVQTFFDRHGIDFKEFMNVGVEVQKIVETNDYMAFRVLEVARGRRK